MPRDILNLSALRIPEHDNEDYVPLEETPKSKSQQHKTTARFICDKETSKDDRVCYYNYGVHEQGSRTYDSYYQYKTSSLPGAVSMAQAWDDIPCSVLVVSPEDIASQLTLLDVQCFKAIRPDELTSCGWTKPNKLTVAPNVVAFTKRFNRVIFWTVQEILNVETPKPRAEVIAHFVKVAKKLHELNNLHSLFAIVSALRSASIFRLTQTWACLSKKDKQTYDKLAEIFENRDNWSALRSYLNNSPLPCIPYLGLFLTDLEFINVFPPFASPHRATKMEVVLKAIKIFQTSEYCIAPLPRITTYLSSVRYIEELQVFVEKDQYKLSERLEAPSPAPSGASSKESIKDTVQGCGTPFSMSPSHRSTSSSFRSHGNAHAAKFHPTHRKCRSLGTNIFCHGKSNTEDAVDRTTPVMSLLDDTVLESPSTNGRMSISLQPGPMPSLQNPTCGYQGCLKRKTMYKDGKKPTLSSWQKYWVQIYDGSLVYFLPKPFKGGGRNEYRCEPCKTVPLEGWSVGVGEADTKDCFQLINNQNYTVYKFRTSCEDSAKEWISKIEEASSKATKPLPDNLLLFE